MMAIPSGLSGQLGLKTEVTYGTAIVTDIFMPFVSLGVETTYEQLPVQGIQAGRSIQYAHKPGRQIVAGAIETELYNKPMATIIKHMFGTVAPTGAGPYVYTATPVGGGLTGKSLTGQGGITDIGGTVRPFQWGGLKFPNWTISAAAGEIAKLQLGIVGKSENITGTPALAAASFLSGISPFSFIDAAVTIGGSAIGVVKNVSLTGDNGLATDRFGLGSATIAEPLETTRRSYTGTISTEFTDMTQYTRFTTGTAAAMVLTFSNGADSLVFTMNAYYTGKTPKVEASTVMLDIPFVCEHATSDASAITAVLTNAEATGP